CEENTMAHMPDRRAFLTSACGAALFTVAGCGQENPAQTKTSSSLGNAPGLMVLNHGNAAEPGSLDPHHIQGDQEDNIVGDLLMGLTTESAQGEPLPGAAEKWETSEDGKTWTF